MENIRAISKTSNVARYPRVPGSPIRSAMDNEFDEAEWSELTDKSLIRRFRAGEQDAATTIYVRYAQRLQNLASSKTNSRLKVQVDPEGIVQSVFRTFFRRVNKGQYDVIGGDELWKLFLVIALNKIRNASKFYRAEKRNVEKTTSFDRINECSVQNDRTDEEALQILKITIDELLADYPGSQRAIILLRVEGCKIDEIAKKTGRAKRSVERTLQQFRNHLNQMIDVD